MTSTRSDQVRQAVARMTTSSWQNTPHFHLSLEVDATDGLGRSKPMALICVAVAQSLVRHPEFNLSWEDERLVRRSSIDLGILVDTPEGLLLPMVRNAEALNLEQMADAIAAAATRARNGRLTPEDYGPRSLSVSNLGMFPVDQLTGVIPAFDILLLGIGRVRTAARWDGQRWVPRQIVNLTFSADHRALSGADAGRLLNTFETVFANPGELT